MQPSTTSQATPEALFTASSGYSVDDLLQTEKYKKWVRIGMPILVIAVFAIGCIVPLWYSGNGWVSNQQVQPHIFSFYTPGLQFGSKTVFAHKGETIKVKVDVHEITDGGLEVTIFPKPYYEYEIRNYNNEARMIVSQAAEKTLTYVSKRSDWYCIEFQARNLPRKLRKGYAAGVFSAEWKVN